jgi:SecD/SecF fusion protein
VVRGIRRYLISIIFVALFVAGLLAASLAMDLKPRLGLDLRGGLSVILAAPSGTRADVLDKTVEILRTRVDRAGVAEPEITREGSTNVLIQLPGTEDPQRLLNLIGRTAQLQFRQVKQEIAETDAEFAAAQVSASDEPPNEVVLFGSDESVKFRLAPAALTGESVRDGTAVIDPATGAWQVELRFNSEGSRIWESFTGELACLQGPERRVAIVLDGRVESAPEVSQEVLCNEGITGGITQITGDFDEREAKDLALVLTTGALPVELEQLEVRTVSPTLGQESLRAGLLAGAFGLALVMLYVLFYYRALGLQTWLGLAIFAATIYGIIAVLGEAIGWSLTLAGIAGLIVAIGIATDSYIVFFERVKEEVHEGRSLRSSIDRGFSQAWKTLRAANGITIMAAIILYWLAVGPVRGFALTLGMATTLDLVVFVAFTWPLAALLARSRLFSEGRFLGMRRALEGGAVKPGKRSLARKIYRSEFNIDFIGRRRAWLLFSAGLLVVSAIALIPAVRGLAFGIDFKGGEIIRVPSVRAVTASEVRSVAAEAGQPDAIVQLLTDPTSGRRQIQVQTAPLDDETRTNLQAKVASLAGVRASDVDFEKVGEKWGQQITTRALRGLAIFFVLVVLYMSWRLEPKMAGTGMVALVHDLIITAGIYALVGFKVSPATVIAILTILGYSLYDTIVVFDKIRENTDAPANARRSFAEIANESMNQVLMRSINTSLSTLLPVGSLLLVGSVLLGAETLKDLALALFVGIAAGTYSSIGVAPQLLSIWKERERRYAKLRRPPSREVAPARPEPIEELPEKVEAYPLEEAPSPARQLTRVQQRKRSRRERKKGPKSR